MNVLACVSWHMCVRAFQVGVELQVIVCSNLLGTQGNATMFFKGVVPIYIPTSRL